MLYNYRFSEEAEWDIYESYIWYEKQEKGLGEDFLGVLDAAEQAILRNPEAYRIRYGKKMRAFVVDRFPYLILYVIDGNNIDVISVFNTSQHPKKWGKRVG